MVSLVGQINASPSAHAPICRGEYKILINIRCIEKYEILGLERAPDSHKPRKIAVVSLAHVAATIVFETCASIF